MNRGSVYLALLNFVAISAHAQDFIWSGSAQCELQVTATGYSDGQMQIWKTTVGPPTQSGAFTLYPATWSAAGSGTLQRTQSEQTLYAYWMRNVEKMSGPISVVTRASDGAVLIGAGHAQLRARDGVTGTQEMRGGGRPFSSTKFGLEAFEYSFPAIEGKPNSIRVMGEKTETRAGSFGPMQPAGAQTIVRCSWDFRKVTRPPGSGPIPAPPPPDCNAAVAALQARHRQTEAMVRARFTKTMQDYDRQRAEAVAQQDNPRVSNLDAERGALERAHVEDLAKIKMMIERDTAAARAPCSG